MDKITVTGTKPVIVDSLKCTFWVIEKSGFVAGGGVALAKDEATAHKIADSLTRIAALEADKAKLIDLLKKYQDGYYTDGVIGLTAGFDEAVSRVLAEVTNA